jgi:hypothetical protein
MIVEKVTGKDLGVLLSKKTYEEMMSWIEIAAALPDKLCKSKQRDRSRFANRTVKHVYLRGIIY